MKKFLSTKYLTSACFLVLLGIMLAGSLRPCYYIAYQQLQNLRAGTGISIPQIEYNYNDSLFGKQSYITLNGAFQRFMGLRHVNDRYRMDNGHLTYVIPKTDVTVQAENTIAFRDTLAEMGIPFGYVSTLFKIDPSDKQLPDGVEDFSGENTDAFLSALEQQDVSVLDLRKREQEQGLDHYSLFYVTDHHWTAETGFWAYTQLIQWLENIDASFSINPALIEASNYTHIVYEDIFCGSAARRVGPLYAGLDDLTIIHPRFDTYLSLAIPEEELYLEGSFDDTLLFYKYLTKINMLEHSAYGVFLDEDKPLLTITNHSHNRTLDVQSTHKKLLILKDSNVLVMAPFLAFSYDDICLIDLRLFEGNLLETIAQYQPDMVLAMYSPTTLEDNNLSMYYFIR